MTVVRVRGFKIFKDRHGKRRCYHRATGIAVDLVKAPFGSVEFLAECERIAATHKAIAPKAGTLGKLILEYRGHAAFTDLAPQTRADYLKVIDYLAPIADTPLVRFDRALVVRIRDKASAKGRRFANYVKRFCRSSLAGGRNVAASRRTRPPASRTYAARKVRLRRTDLGATKSATPPSR